jgi:hypothetical protein
MRLSASCSEFKLLIFQLLNSHYWTDRYPWIVEAARKVRRERFVIDGEAVILLAVLPSWSSFSGRAQTMIEIWYELRRPGRARAAISPDDPT